MSIEKVYAKDGQLAGKEVRRPGRKFEIHTQNITGNEQGVPIRLMGGTAEVAGVFITPVFNLRKKEIKEEGGK